MKSKRTYSSVDVNKVEHERLMEKLAEPLVVIGIDVAKRRQMAAFCQGDGQQKLLVRFEHPRQTPIFMSLVGGLVEGGKKVQVVMEPTGTYGDILCQEAEKRKAEVYWISPKRTHDAAEVFDGVPSYHDAKDATVVARLHAQGVSRRWQPAEHTKREMRALVARREIYRRQQEVLFGELEGLMARHWPEAEQVLDVRQQSSALKLLVEYPDPRMLSRASAQVEQLLREASRGRLGHTKAQELIQGAQGTLGVEMLPEERELLRTIAAELLRTQTESQHVEAQLAEKVEGQEQMRKPSLMVGMTTVAVLYAYLGELSKYESAQALEKAMGLNLKEASSGERRRPQQRGVHLTKRGPGIVRKYLHLAVLRWVQSDAIAAAWYRKRQGYTEQSKLRAVVALMRKLVRAIWHLSRGSDYDAARLFDVRRLAPIKGAAEPQPSQEATM